MSHYQQLKFVESARLYFPQHFSSAKVLEIGSWDNNGSVRSFFPNCDYLGVDIAPGNGVDFIGQGENIEFPTASFDTVVSCECFEHNPYWLETFINMWRMLKPGGLCVVSCATLGRREHGTQRTTPGDSLTSEVQLSDYYRNLTAKDFRTRIDLGRLFQGYSFYNNFYSRDLYFVGIKQYPKHHSSNELDDRFVSIGNRLNQVTTESGATLAQRILVNAEWAAYRFLSYAFGSYNVRNIEFALSSLKRRFKSRRNSM